MNHIELGQKGESIASQHLLSRGFDIKMRNYTHKNAEIDIVCEKNRQLIIVEVKTRFTDIFGDPSKAVTLKKQRQIIKTANNYIEQYDVDLDVRFDVVSVILNNSAIRVRHIENAFYPIV